MLPPLLTLALLVALPVFAQDDPLRHAFEGKTVAVRMDMPGDDGGINVHPEQEDAVDYRKVGDSLKRYGVSLRKGDEVTITKVHLKPKLIEFQLGGGGFGSWGDSVGRPSVPSTYVPKSKYERDLERERSSATGDRRRTIDRRLDDLRRSRQREESYARSTAGRAQSEAQEWEQERRLRSGSRFNMHYPNGVPPQAATPEAIMTALAEYVDFSPMQPRRSSGGQLRTRLTPGVAAVAPAANPASLRKGMTEDEVQRTIGAPASRRPGGVAAGLAVVNSVYSLPSATVTAQFVNGVLAKFTIASK